MRSSRTLLSQSISRYFIICAFCWPILWRNLCIAHIGWGITAEKLSLHDRLNEFSSSDRLTQLGVDLVRFILSSMLTPLSLMVDWECWRSAVVTEGDVWCRPEGVENVVEQSDVAVWNVSYVSSVFVNWFSGFEVAAGWMFRLRLVFKHWQFSIQNEGVSSNSNVWLTIVFSFWLLRILVQFVEQSNFPGCEKFVPSPFLNLPISTNYLPESFLSFVHHLPKFWFHLSAFGTGNVNILYFLHNGSYTYILYNCILDVLVVKNV